jgi:hypothetical protein
LLVGNVHDDFSSREVHFHQIDVPGNLAYSQLGFSPLSFSARRPALSS